MKTPDQNLLDKYFNGTATRKEAEIILEWFQSVEGTRYLENHFQNAASSNEINSKVPIYKVRKHAVLNSILHRISRENTEAILKKPIRNTRRNSYKLVAATILVLFSLLFLLQIIHTNTPDVEYRYSTGPYEMQRVNLSDGSMIGLSENSKLTISEDPSNEDFEISLEGQAYFNVSSRENREFRIYTDDTEVSVLGTVFNIKSNNQTGQVIVAVEKGKVSFKNVKQNSGTTLTENMIGIYETNNMSLHTESSEVHNYMSWYHGSIVFTNTPFEEVLQQLERIFDITNKIESDDLNSLRLTANFKRGSLEHTLSTIAEGLNIDYTIRNGTIHWNQKTN
ncbi:FecR family protein [Rhodohalobacter sp. SW132]|uniref:FecR family protein n=1 Tax=Rhodohalobacter sp. SW132 TaxID=2293433 RepID=UPI001313FF71|nr:FecR family protein [Rhodohalobacter sp. SW132]